MKLSQNPNLDSKKPYVDCLINLEEILFSLNSKQVYQIMILLSDVKKFNKLVQNIKKQKTLSADQQDSLKNNFFALLKKNLRSKEELSIAELGPPQQQTEFRQALIFCPRDVLYQWVIEATKEFLQETRIEEVEKSKKKWFSLFSKEVEITEQEKNKIQQIIDQSFNVNPYQNKR